MFEYTLARRILRNDAIPQVGGTRRCANLATLATHPLRLA